MSSPRRPSEWRPTAVTTEAHIEGAASPSQVLSVARGSNLSELRETDAQVAARALGVALQSVEVRGAEGFETAARGGSLWRCRPDLWASPSSRSCAARLAVSGVPQA